MPAEEADWNSPGEAGLLNDFDFTVTKAFFAPDQGYMNGDQTMLQLEGTTDDPEQPTTHLWFSCGNGWESRDGGKTVDHPQKTKNSKKFFNQASWMHRLLNRCIEELDLYDVLKARGSVFSAAPWVGLSFHMNMEEVDFGGNIGVKTHLMPTAFLGADSKAAAAAPAPKTEAAAPKTGQTAAEKLAAKKAEREAAAASNGGGASLRDQVVAIFTEETDFATAQEKASQLPGIDADDELVMSILEEGGLWAEVKAGA